MNKILITEFINQESLDNLNKKFDVKYDEKLTIREQARLQGFPDWVDFEGTKYSQSKQIGNAVPPIFAYHLFKRIFSYL